MTAAPHRRVVAFLGAAALLASVQGAVASAGAPAVDAGRATVAVSAALPTSWPAVTDLAARMQPWLERTLAAAPAGVPLRVMVSGETTASAQAAVTAAGMTTQQTWGAAGVVVALGLPDQVRAVVGLPGVRYVEGDEPLAFTLDTAHRATRSDVALDTLSLPGTGTRIDGSGVTIAVIDSGIDSSHPMFRLPDGRSKVVRNLKNACGAVLLPGTSEVCFQPISDTDSVSAGGHGTHVAGIAAGSEVTTSAPAGVQLRGSAPGARLVGLSVGAAVGLVDANAAMAWVVDHQQNPCRSAAQQTEAEVDADCPPIRVTNHSYGPTSTPEGGFSFDESSATVTLQRALVAQGVTPVWAAGNSGGDGSLAQTNPPAMDPTPGVLMVASYDDAQAGDRDGELSDSSSRGAAGDPGTFPDVSAPGDLITSACRPQLVVCQGTPSYDGLDYQTISGTSMAAPYVAGVVAQLVQADPRTTPGQGEKLLEDTAHAFSAGAGYRADPRNPDSLTSFDKGHGLVDVLALLTAQQGQLSTGVPPTGPGTVRDLDSACPTDRVPRDSRQDVRGNTHERAVDCVIWWEIALGTSSTAYGPRAGVTREQMAAFVARLVEQAGGRLDADAPNAFSDDDSSHHHASINRLAAAGVIDGKGGGRFAPTETVNRAQMAKFIVNAYEHVSDRSLSSSGNAFSDDDGHVLERFIDASAGAGFTTGRDGRYEPAAPVLRDQMASFLARPLDLLVGEGTTPLRP